MKKGLLMLILATISVLACSFCLCGCANISKIFGGGFGIGVCAHTWGEWEDKPHLLYSDDKYDGVQVHCRRCSSCGYEEYEAHSMFENMCTVCGHSDFYLELTNDEQSYAVTGLDQYFNGDSLVIPSTHNGLSVTEIRDDVFNDMYEESYNNITSITIPSSITNIGGGNFPQSNGLKINYLGSLSQWCEINSLHTWGTYNYENYIPATADLYIGGVKIEGDLVIPDGVTCIGDGAFYNRSGVTSVTIPNTVTEIGNFAFFGCNSLETATAPAEVVYYIQGGEFDQDSSSLQTINITGGNYLYRVQSSVNTIRISESVSVIEEEAFYDCVGLTIYCEAESSPDGWKSGWNRCRYSSPAVIWDCNNYNKDIDGYEYAIIDGLRYGFKDGKAIIAAQPKHSIYYRSGNESLVFPSRVTYQGTDYEVSGVINNAFDGCKGLIGITLPNSITEIGDYAFYDCKSLINITLPNNITEIGDCVFFGCDELKSIVLPNGLKSIGHQAISCCDALTSIDIPSGVTDIDYYAFAYDDNLETVSIPDSVVNLGNDIFKDCNNLKIIEYLGDLTSWCEMEWLACVMAQAQTVKVDGQELTGDLIIPNGVSRICDCAFLNRAGLTGVVIPNSVTQIGEKVFSGCLGLTSITIPDSVTEMAGNAFSGCDNLVSVTSRGELVSLFPKSGIKSFTINGGKITNAEEFKNYEALESITIDADIGDYSSLDGLLYNKNKTEIVVAPIAIKGTITIPSSVTSIGMGAFSGCGNLTEVEMSNGVTEIGSRAFYGCENITALTISGDVTNIGDDAFSGCNNIRTATLPTPVFAHISIAALQELVINGGEEIANWAFNNSNLKSVTLGESVKSIGIGAFEKSTDLSSIILSASLTTIKANAFWNCFKLSSMVIPSSVSDIDKDAFVHCRMTLYFEAENSLSWREYGGASLPIVLDCKNNDKDNNGYAYTVSDGIRYRLKDGKASVFEQPDMGGNIVIPSTIRYNNTDYPVTSISNMAFYHGNFTANTYIGIKSIELPDGLTSIGERAFYDCENMTSINIPSSVTNIGRNAFNSNKLSYNISNGVKYLGNSGNPFFAVVGYVMGETVYSIKTDSKIIASGAFSQNNSLTNIVIPNNITNIGEYAFGDCKNLSKATISNSITDICSSVFASCSNLKTIKIPDNVRNIYSGAFARSGLITIEIPSGVSFIGEGVFKKCESLTSASFPNSLKKINDSMFEGCSNLTGFTIPNGVNSIGLRAFASSGLKNITIPTNVTSIKREAFASSGLTGIDIPRSVRNIESNVFDSCKELSYVNLHDNLLSIGSYAFSGCSKLTEITIPNGVKSIGDEAFSFCDLRRFTVPLSATTLGSGICSRNDRLSTIYCSVSVALSGWDLHWHYKTHNGDAYTYHHVTWG